MLARGRWIEFGMLLLALACLMLAARFLMLGLGADNAFTQLVLALSYPLVVPFLHLFGGFGAHLEFPTLIAIAFYLLVGWGLGWLLRTALFPRFAYRA